MLVFSSYENVVWVSKSLIKDSFVGSTSSCKPCCPGDRKNIWVTQQICVSCYLLPCYFPDVYRTFLYLFQFSLGIQMRLACALFFSSSIFQKGIMSLFSSLLTPCWFSVESQRAANSCEVASASCLSTEYLTQLSILHLFFFLD